MTSPLREPICCLCGKRFAGADPTTYLLDAEWRRRHPNMRGRFACDSCVLRDPRYYWQCRDDEGAYPAGHIPTRHHRPPREDCDSWDHTVAHGTVAWMRNIPEDALRSLLRGDHNRTGLDPVERAGR